MPPILIGLLGKARSGKDTVANHLCAEFNFQKIAFATPIKDITELLFDLSPDVREGPAKEEIDLRYGVSPRFLWQIVAAKMREIRSSVWIDFVLRKYTQNKNNENFSLVISDVRLRDEVQAIRQIGGYIWKITCPDGPTLSEQLKYHPTEVELDTITEYDSLLSAEYGNIDSLLHQVNARISETFGNIL